MKLEKYLRTEYSYYIRPVLIKKECELCCSKDNLNLHHESQFDKLLKETLRDLNLNYKDTKDYSIIELQNISNIILGKQLKCKYYTLCDKCHKKTHAGKQNSLYYEIQKEKNKVNRIKYINEILIPYLDSILEIVILTKDAREILINTIDCKSNGKLLKTVKSLNLYLSQNNINYKIKQFETSRTIDGIKKNYKSAWRIEKIN